MKKHLIVIGTFVLLMVVGLGGCFNIFEEMELDPVINRAKPYIEKIILNDIEIRAYANSIIKNCNSGDKECQINSIYRYIVENFNYISDPIDTELIQSPEETIQIGGGDCEDFSILFISLLENIGIKTYLVMNETHAYSLAYDVNTNELWKNIEKSFIDKVEIEWGDSIKQNFENTFILEGYQVWYYGDNGSSLSEYVEYLNISYKINSSRPIHLYVVPSKDDYNNLIQQKTFNHYPDYEVENLLKEENVFPYANSTKGIILNNENRRESTVSVNISYYYHPSFYKYFEDEEITSYLIDGKRCIVVDCTLGEWGYPGYEAGIKGEKVAIDPVSKEYHYLS